MGWLDRFQRKSGSGADLLREALFDAAEVGDEEALAKICRDNRNSILAEFPTWLKVPTAQREDPKAVSRYGRGLTAVADWFARNGSPQPREMLQGGADNPLPRWEQQFAKADTLKIEGRFAEAVAILEQTAKEMGTHQGSAIEKYLPMVHGSLGECLFRMGHFDRAYEATRAALDGCQRNGDVKGMIGYCGNLAEICGKRGDVDQAKYWLIVTTNAMIQTGEVERAAQVRRAHGLEPTAGLIEVKRPMG